MDPLKKPMMMQPKAVVTVKRPWLVEDPKTIRKNYIYLF